MLCDYHVHTHLSYDSQADIDSVITSAINKGMKYMAITDHHDFDLDDHVFELSPDAYYDTLLPYRDKYKDEINLSIGIELGIDAGNSRRLYDFIKKRPFDFVIGSVHGVDGLDPYYENYWNGLTTEEGMRKYFSAIADSLKVYDDFDVLGHIDYAIRYARRGNEQVYSYDTYGDILDFILKTVISMGKGIEINTGGLRKGLKSTNPSVEVIKRYREYGGEIITVGSDAHVPQDIGADFDCARQILLKCGFTKYCVFEKRKPVFLPL